MLPDWLDKSVYPFAPKRFRTPAGEMSYVDEGQGDAFVFVHGNPSWSFEHRELIQHFSQQYRCVSADHIGFGLSDKPTDWSYLPAAHASNLESLLESLDLHNITMIVDDWGGPIGLSYAIHHPERIQNIIITNTWLWSVKNDGYYQLFSKMMGGFIGRWLIKRFNFFVNGVLPMIFADRKRFRRELQRYYQLPLADPNQRKGCYTLPWEIIGSSEWLQSLWEQREALQGKVKLIAWGTKDIAFRKKERETFARAFPEAPVVIFEDAGHFVAEEQPEKLITAIETHVLRT